MYYKYYDTLCISGGGTKIISILGALIEINNKHFFDINKINKFICCSAGTIISFMLSMGYTVEELINFIINFNFLSMEPHIDCDLLFNKLGLDDGSKLNYLLKKFIKKKLNVNDITFLEHYELTKKKIIISVTNYTKSKIEYFDYTTQPNLSICDAIRMSCSIPGYFIPFLYNECYYVDGAVLDNFPIQLCNKESSLGILIKTNIEKKKLPEIHMYLYSIINMITGSNVKYKLKIYEIDVLQIIIEHENLINLSMNTKDKLNLISIGRNTFIKYYNNIIKSYIKSILNDIINNIF